MFVRRYGNSDYIVGVGCFFIYSNSTVFIFFDIYSIADNKVRSKAALIVESICSSSRSLTLCDGIIGDRQKSYHSIIVLFVIFITFEYKFSSLDNFFFGEVVLDNGRTCEVNRK